LLHLIYGRAGAGKTHYILKQIKDFIQAGVTDLVLVIPEQESFQTERAVLHELGAREAQFVQVLSFTRLAASVAKEEKLCAVRGVNDSLKSLAMLEALGAARDRLHLYSRADRRRIPDFLHLASELEAAAANSTKLLEAAEELHGTVKQKCDELAHIIENYEAILTARYGGRGDTLELLAEALRQTHWFKGKTVFLDSFRGFTGEERRIVKLMLEQASHVYVTLIGDGPGVLGAENVFAHTERAYLDLQQDAKDVCCVSAKPLRLSGENKFCNFPPAHNYHKSASMRQLELFLAKGERPQTSDASDIVNVSCADRERECAWVAAEIHRLLREKDPRIRTDGLRCRDIAITARNFSDYEAPLAAAMKKAGIPVYLDTRRPLQHQPLMRLCTAALQIAADGFRTETVFTLLKTGLAGLDMNETAELETYCFRWRIDGAGFLHPWNMDTRGFGDYSEDNAEDKAAEQNRRESLNRLRLRLVKPLQSLCKALKDTTVPAACAALFSYVNSLDVSRSLAEQRQQLTDMQDTVTAEMLPRIWRAFVQILDYLTEASQAAEGLSGDLADQGTEKATDAKAFYDMFSLVLGGTDLGELPPMLDCVVAGEASRSRFQSPRILFAMGLTDGVFPSVPTQPILLSEAERELLKGTAAGLKLRDTRPELVDLESLLVYQTLCAPTERLYLTHPRRDTAGAGLAPSPLLARIFDKKSGCFPDSAAITEADTPANPEECADSVEFPAAAFDMLCALEEGTPLHRALRELTEEDGRFAAAIEALNRLNCHELFSLEGDKEACALLLPLGSTISPTRLETFAKCPFRHYMKYALKAQVIQPAAFDSLLRGNIIHTAFEEFLDTVDYPEALSVDALLEMPPEEVRRRFRELTDSIGKRVLEQEAMPKRGLWLYKRLQEVMEETLGSVLDEFRDSGFRPAAFELPIGRRAAVGPYRLSLPEGELLFSGKTDRVDIDSMRGAFRIADYKSYTKAFDLSSLYDGIDLQMLLYLFAVADNGINGEAPLQPAAVMYQPVKDKTVSLSDRSKTAEALKEEKEKARKPDGLIVEGLDSGYGTVLTSKMVAVLRRDIEDILRETAKRLLVGDISVYPLEKDTDFGGFGTCDDCEYHAACGHEIGEECRGKYALTKATVLEYLEAAAAEGEEQE
jgi:ATP-dependent helicase/nuclease subunit B